MGRNNSTFKIAVSDKLRRSKWYMLEGDLGTAKALATFLFLKTDSLDIAWVDVRGNWGVKEHDYPIDDEFNNIQEWLASEIRFYQQGGHSILDNDFEPFGAYIGSLYKDVKRIRLEDLEDALEAARAQLTE